MNKARKFFSLIQAAVTAASFMACGAKAQTAPDLAGINALAEAVRNPAAKDLAAFASNIRTIEVGRDGHDDVEAKIGQPFSKTNFGGRETWQYMRPAMAWVQFTSSGKVIAVRVAKLDGVNMVDVFTRGEFQLFGSSSSAEEAPASRFVETHADPPASPREGQIYFNKTNKQFYGWNGDTWMKLGGN